MFLWLSFFSQAEAAQFYMWGVGPSAQTNIYPFGYPLSFPTTSVTGANPSENMTKPTFVGSIGGKFTAYLNQNIRGAIRPIYSLGSSSSGYTGISVSMEVDRIVASQNGIQLFWGGGLGTGGFSFDQGDAGVLSGRTLYLRGHGGTVFISGQGALELSLFAELGFVGEERYVYEDTTYTNGGFFNKDDTGSLGWGVYYPIIGIECTGYFGKFYTPTPRKKRRRRRR